MMTTTRLEVMSVARIGGIASQHNRGVKVKSGVRADLKRA